MEEKHDEGGFSYVYSAEEQAELKKIRDKYVRPTESEDKMEKLRRLDQSVTQKASSISLTIGIIGTLLLGFGMSICLTDVAAIFGDNESLAMLVGIIIGVLGGAIAALSYPMYCLILKRERKKIAPQIISLTDELIK